MDNYIGMIKIGNKEYLNRWGEIQGIRFDTNTSDQDHAKDILNEVCEGLANGSQREVRWEFEGIGQGHYVSPTKDSKTICPNCHGGGDVEVDGEWVDCPVCKGTGMMLIREINNLKAE